MTHKILVVEDERDIADLLRYHLEREGFRVVTGSWRRMRFPFPSVQKGKEAFWSSTTSPS